MNKYKHFDFNIIIINRCVYKIQSSLGSSRIFQSLLFSEVLGSQQNWVKITELPHTLPLPMHSIPYHQHIEPILASIAQLDKSHPMHQKVSGLDTCLSCRLSPL